MGFEAEHKERKRKNKKMQTVGRRYVIKEKGEQKKNSKLVVT